MVKVSRALCLNMLAENKRVMEHAVQHDNGTRIETCCRPKLHNSGKQDETDEERSQLA